MFIRSNMSLLFPLISNTAWFWFVRNLCRHSSKIHQGCKHWNVFANLIRILWPLLSVVISWNFFLFFTTFNNKGKHSYHATRDNLAEKLQDNYRHHKITFNPGWTWILNDPIRISIFSCKSSYSNNCLRILPYNITLI